MNWINQNIEYVSDTEQWGDEEFWMLPDETARKRKGDCEDMAIFFLTVIKEYENEEGYLIGIEDGGDRDHAVAKVGEYYYDCTSNIFYKGTPKIAFVLNYGWMYDEIYKRRE